MIAIKSVVDIQAIPAGVDYRGNNKFDILLADFSVGYIEVTDVVEFTVGMPPDSVVCTAKLVDGWSIRCQAETEEKCIKEILEGIRGRKGRSW